MVVVDPELAQALKDAAQEVRLARRTLARRLITMDLLLKQVGLLDVTEDVILVGSEADLREPSKRDGGSEENPRACGAG